MLLGSQKKSFVVSGAKRSGSLKKAGTIGGGGEGGAGGRRQSHDFGDVARLIR